MLHQSIKVSILQKTAFKELLCKRTMRCEMNLRVRYTCLNHLQRGIMRIQNGLVDELLICSKFAVYRKCTGNVRYVAMEFTSHVIEHHITIYKFLIVWSTPMSIMQDASVVPTSTNTSISME